MLLTVTTVVLLFDCTRVVFTPLLRLRGQSRVNGLPMNIVARSIVARARCTARRKMRQEVETINNYTDDIPVFDSVRLLSTGFEFRSIVQLLSTLPRKPTNPVPRLAVILSRETAIVASLCPVRLLLHRVVFHLGGQRLRGIIDFYPPLPPKKKNWPIEPPSADDFRFIREVTGVISDSAPVSSNLSRIEPGTRTPTILYTDGQRDGSWIKVTNKRSNR